jgi:hypothetical protein
MSLSICCLIFLPILWFPFSPHHTNGFLNTTRTKWFTTKYPTKLILPDPRVNYESSFYSISDLHLHQVVQLRLVLYCTCYNSNVRLETTMRGFHRRLDTAKKRVNWTEREMWENYQAHRWDRNGNSNGELEAWSIEYPKVQYVWQEFQKRTAKTNYNKIKPQITTVNRKQKFIDISSSKATKLAGLSPDFRLLKIMLHHSKRRETKLCLTQKLHYI